MHRRTALLVLSALALAACSASDAASPPTPTPGLVGTLPAATQPTPRTEPTPPSTEDGPTSTGPATISVRPAPGTQVGELVKGNRLLVIGDSVMAALSSRYGNQLCTDLVWRRWAVEVDAEVGRPITFGRQVLAERMAAGWDAAVVMLGNNYDGDAPAFKAELDALLDQLGPIPVVLATVTRFRPEQDQVNYILATTANERPNVQLVDWQDRTAQPDADTLLTGDGLHPNDEGRFVLAALLTNALGTAPTGQVGACLPSSFTDDSMGSVTGGPPSSSLPSSSSSTPRTSSSRRRTTSTTTTVHRRRKGS